MHTPGPWRHATKGNFGNCVEGPSGKHGYEGDDGYRTVAMVQSCTSKRLPNEEDANLAANIALIAAGPDLVDALEDILRIARHDDSALCVARIVDTARAALAKASP